MKKGLLLTLFLILGLGVIATLILLLSPTQKVEQNMQTADYNSTQEIVFKKIIEKKGYSWVDKITPAKEQEYLYPVTELHIKLN